MKQIIKEVEVKLNHLVWTLVVYGAFFLILAVLIVFTNYVLQVLVGLALLLLSYVLFYMSFKVHAIKKIIGK